MTEKDRYTRHTLLWGEQKQETLRRSTVLVAGIGGLGATVAQLLARAGVGKLILVDEGTIDWPDLNRQTLYGEGDIGKKKVAVAAEALGRINTQVEVFAWDVLIDSSFRVPQGISVVADCLDNFVARFDLYRGTPDNTFFVHAGVQGEFGQVLTLLKGESQPLDLIFAGSLQPSGMIPVTPDGAVILAGLQTKEVFQTLWKTPLFMNRFMIVDLNTCSWSSLQV